MNPQTAALPDNRRADCLDCAHYYITHDVHFRYGCRALDFKSQRPPGVVVMEASGEPCHYFCAKRKAGKPGEAAT